MNVPYPYLAGSMKIYWRVYVNVFTHTYIYIYYDDEILYIYIIYIYGVYIYTVCRMKEACPVGESSSSR